MTPPSLVGRTLVAAVALVMLSACSGGSDPAPDEDAAESATAGSSASGSGSDPVEPAFETPRRGECRRLTDADIEPMTNDSPVVKCSARHTAVTYLVGQLPARAKPTERFYASNRCSKTFLKALGATIEVSSRSLFSFAFFRPDGADRKAGARWFRCDLVARVEDGLLPLPAGGTPLLRGATLPDRYAACLTLAGDYVACDRTHAYRASDSFTGPEVFPGRAGILELAGVRCPPLTGTSQWYATWSLQRSWNAGARDVRCWAANGS